MEEYETEEQQLQAIKRWWNENGTSLLIGLGLGVAGIFGWNTYLTKQHTHSVEASDMYISVMAQADTRSIDVSGQAIAKKLVAEYADTPYASLTSLALAKHEFEKGNVDGTVSHLEWVVEHGTEEGIQHIARLRMARVLLDQKKHSEVESLLSAEHPPAFDSRYQELKGDLFVAQGEIGQARVAYDKAIKQEVNASQWLLLKRQDLGPSTISKVVDIEPST
jgi:predicted negative regulator of RcsB-dependent stress response